MTGTGTHVAMTDAHADQVLDIYRRGIATGHAAFETDAPTWEAFAAGGYRITASSL